MKKYTLTFNAGPQMQILDMHLSMAKAYIKDNNLTVVKAEEHIKDNKYQNVITLKEVKAEGLGL